MLDDAGKDEFAESGGNLLTELPFAAFIFDPENNASTGSGGHFNYTIQVETEQVYMSWWLPVQLFYGLDPRNVLLNFVDSSIAYGLDGRTRIDTEIQAMDYMFNRARALAVADQLAYILFPFALTFLLPVFMNLIVYEKEAKLKELMKMSGMQMKYYWVVNYCYNYAMYCVVVIAFSISCWSVQIRLWTQTSFFILFTLLFLWGHALVSLSFLLSTLLDRDLTSSLAGYVIVVAGVLASLVFNATVFYRDEPPMLYMMYAPLAFYRAIFIMTTSCSRFACMTMDDLGAEMLRIYFYLILDTLLYWLGFSYLDKVLPSKYGVPEHPLYFLKPVLAWLNRHRTAPETEAQALNVVDDDEDRADDGHDHAVADPMAPNAASAAEKEMERRRGRTLPKDETEDSRQEREMMLRSRNPNEFAVQMLGLHHEYDRSVVANKAKARTALVDLFLSIGANESQALLGPNGAGKSTLISILTGLFQPTSGTADVCGLDIRTHMKDIHKIIGICPQFSILWDTLTCAEHLLFFARLKGVPADEQRAFVSRTLEQVGLGLAADRLAQNLSGGMKRRLSIAMALVGDPLFLVMDEPTTGLDPETREELWRTLLKIRENGPAILLATHAMDEAELLCGRVSILSRGTLKCVGNPHSLRERFCPNYTLNVNFAPGFDKDVVLELLPGCELVSEFEVSASFEVQAAEARRMSVIFKKMEGAVEMGRVANWGLVRAGLEGVFLDVVQDEIVSH
jgi:ABC-type multidrug transport system ATPase subunit